MARFAFAAANLVVASSFAIPTSKRRHLFSVGHLLSVPQRSWNTAPSNGDYSLENFLDELSLVPEGVAVAGVATAVVKACAQTSALLAQGSSGDLFEQSCGLFDQCLAGVCPMALVPPSAAASVVLGFSNAESANGLVLVATPLDVYTDSEAAACAGSVFALYEATLSCEELDLGVLPGGRRTIVAAGYCVYSSSTQLVFASKYHSGKKSISFTLDPTTQAFVCSEAGMQTPSIGKNLVVDYASSAEWPSSFLEFISAAKEGLVGGPFGSRFSGSAVSDVHRILRTGGCFCHPTSTTANPGLPLLSMAAPLAYIAEYAGGKALLQIQGTPDEATSLAASSSLYLGSEPVINSLLGYLDKGR